MEWGWESVREGRGKGGIPGGGIWVIFFNFMPPLPPDVDLYILVDLWIIRKTDSDHV